MTQAVVATTQPRGVIADMAARYAMSADAFERTLRATVFPGDASREQFAAFVMVAKKYDLDPILKQIYAFPDKRGGVIPIVSIDGWLHLAQTHDQFDGMTFNDQRDDKGQIFAITCTIHRKDRTHPIEVTEYLSECKRDTEVWKRWPARMLRHRATIQAIRYAFGYSAIYDEEEAERILVAQDVTQANAPADPPKKGVAGLRGALLPKAEEPSVTELTLGAALGELDKIAQPEDADLLLDRARTMSEEDQAELRAAVDFKFGAKE